ncbi:SAM-dependent methyltransferase [Halobacteriovorax sp.]|uniref:SAM-dependent methyltransferase n=1 Tax=Halobacteriovorax sp. TaxID=2020862 RepID=UPI003565A866
MKGVLTLIPTPIDEDSPLEQVAFKQLKEATENPSDNIFIIEDLKPGRRRWLKFGLTRDLVEDFVLFNEHSRVENLPIIMQALKSGKNAFIMSDGGLPAFCDPGVELVKACHQNNIKVTATPFSNSISLALALSGIDHSKFTFGGFLPIKSPERDEELKSILSRKETIILMDTPYRMKKLLDEVNSLKTGRLAFLAMDLNCPSEELHFGKLESITKKVKDFKREFILILSP